MALGLDQLFMSTTFRNHQIVRLMEFSQTELHIKLSKSSVARAFAVDPKVVRHALKRGYSIPEGRGQHQALSDEVESQLLQWIEKKAQNNEAIGRTELLDYTNSVLGEAVTRGWVDSFIHRHTAGLFETKSLPQENPRLQVPRIFLERAIECLRGHVPGSVAELVFNLDEVGISEWEDRSEKKVIVPVSMRGHKVHHGIHRNLKHISVVVCITAAGESLTPFFVSSQFTAPVEMKLKQKGMRLGLDMIIRKRDRPYMNADLFLEYITKVFIPYIVELRSNEEFAGRPAILLMDNCSLHMGEDVIRVLSEHQVKVITFPPHTTNIFQMLDLSLFGVLKRKMHYKLPLGDDDSVTEFLRKIFHILKQTVVEDNVRSSFLMLGFEFDIDFEPYILRFDETKLRQSPGFLELWHIDYPLEDLSKRRQEARFGWVNQEEYERFAA